VPQVSGVFITTRARARCRRHDANVSVRSYNHRGMKTRTLLLLSVGTALMILIAGGVLLFQLSNQETVVDVGVIGEPTSIGDLDITVFGATSGGDVLSVDVELAGVDDDLSGITLVTGDRRLDPLLAPSSGRCTEITVAAQRCVLEFDTSSSASSNRTLLIVRGDAQRTWQLEAF